MNDKTYKSIRLECGMSQAEAAMVLGVSRETISRRESGSLKIGKEAEMAILSIAPTEKQKRMAIHSARYILEELNHEKGMESLSELSGLPMGVIVSAFQNIFSTNRRISPRSEA